MTENLLILAFETTLPNLSITIANENSVIDNYISDGRVSGSNELLTAADLLLKKNSLSLKDLSHLAVCAGPGSFTGIRVGLATVKALAYGLGCQALGVSLLESLALMALDEQPRTSKITAAVFAGKNQLFTQSFSVRAQRSLICSETAPNLTASELFINQTKSMSEDETLIMDKKNAAEIYINKSLAIPANNFIASDNVADFIARRAVQIINENGEGSDNNEKNLTQYNFKVEPLYVRKFRIGQ